MPAVRRLAYLVLAWVSFATGVVGAFLPLLPTTCFMLLAVWAASRGSPRFAAWIREHPRFGPAVLAWEGERAIPRHAKWLSAVMLAASMLVLALTVSLWWLKLSLIAGLCLVGVWIVSRPEPAVVR